MAIITLPMFLLAVIAVDESSILDGDVPIQHAMTPQTPEETMPLDAAYNLSDEDTLRANLPKEEQS